MIASEVPMQSCIRTSSGTPNMRNTSNSTGTITAPPPIPNRPASTPVRIPATMMPAASQSNSPVGTAIGSSESSILEPPAALQRAGNVAIETGVKREMAVVGS